MPAGVGGGLRGWTFFIVLIIVCAGALTFVAFYPAPATSACSSCLGRNLTTILSVGPGTNDGNSSAYYFCFPVEAVHGGLQIENLDVGIRYPDGLWLPGDANYTVNAVAGNETVMATYYFVDHNHVEGPLWVGAVDAPVTTGYSFCLSTGVDNLVGLTFVLVGVGLDPHGQVAEPIP